ncbi:hypothetical protein PtB15_4B72 [Puccinia triticina]|nr:hypothetical protein PtB15_4B72 [Puccinia triticina]
MRASDPQPAWGWLRKASESRPGGCTAGEDGSMGSSWSEAEYSLASSGLSLGESEVFFGLLLPRPPSADPTHPHTENHRNNTEIKRGPSLIKLTPAIPTMPAVSFAAPPLEAIKKQSHTSSDLRSPLPTLRSKSAYYHPSYHPADSPNVDLVLASSDKISCWFAISRAQLFCHDDAFRSVGLELITPDTNLPLVKLGESRAVIEVILSCLQADTIPDFGHLDFRVLMSALEAAADKYRLVHMEKICLLAMGAYCQTHPVEVYTLASHYSCRWLTEAASEHTLSLDINQPKYRDILSSENHSALLELHRYRTEAAKTILRSLQISAQSGHEHRAELESFWARSAATIETKILRPDTDFKALFTPELHNALIQFPSCARCYAAIVRLQNRAEKDWLAVRRAVLDLSAKADSHRIQCPASPYHSDEEDS